MTASWSLGTAALQGAACWSDVFLPEHAWGDYARAAAAVPSPSEVYIALAIREDVEGATAAFEHLYFRVIEHALGRVGATADEVAELTTLMRCRLFGRPRGGLPLVVAYAGSGQLRALLRIAVLRAFVERRACLGRPVLANGPGLLPILDALPETARLVLRLCILHGLGITDIAVRARMDRAVAARKLVRARELLLATPLDDVTRDVIDVLVDSALAGD